MLTQDPIGLAGGVNLYAYAGNNPTSFSDPWGLTCPENEPCPKEKQDGWGAAFKAKVADVKQSLYDGAAALGGAARDFLTAAGKEVATQAALFALTEGAGNAARILTKADVVVDGLKAFDGMMSVANGQATISVNMIEGEINGARMMNALRGLATAEGATALRIEGRIANEQLYNVLRARYGLRTEGGLDIIEMALPH